MRTLISTLTIAAMTAPPLPSQDHPLPPLLAEGATLEVIHADPEGFYEGPVWHTPTASLYFTSCRPEKVHRVDASGEVTVWQENNGGLNGMMLREGVTLPGGAVRDVLVGAQVMGHRVVLVPIEPDGSAGEMVTVAHRPDWNQPNDVWWAPNGVIYFTDPSWADHSRSAVWSIRVEAALAGTATPERIITEMPVPNGVITDAGATKLIVSDSNQMLWREYPIRPDGSLGPQALFFDPPVENRLDPDGMALDPSGDLWICGRGGVWQITAEGAPRGFVPTPAFCSNVTVGGAENEWLYLTGRGHVWRVGLARD